MLKNVKKIMPLILPVLFLLSACGKQDEQNNQKEKDENLVQASLSCDVQEISRLLKAGANPNALIEYVGAINDINGNNKFTNNPLHSAAMSVGGVNDDCNKAVDMLLAAGANPNIQNLNGTTPIMMAAGTQGNIYIVNKLLKAGANVKITSKLGSNGLLEAVLAVDSKKDFLDNGDIEILQALLKAGADPNIVSPYNKQTPLMSAARAAAMRPIPKNIEIIKILLAAGANPNLKDNSGKTAATYAAERGHKDIAALIQKYEKK